MPVVSLARARVHLTCGSHAPPAPCRKAEPRHAVLPSLRKDALDRGLLLIVGCNDDLARLEKRYSLPPAQLVHEGVAPNAQARLQEILAVVHAAVDDLAVAQEVSRPKPSWRSTTMTSFCFRESLSAMARPMTPPYDECMYRFHCGHCIRVGGQGRYAGRARARVTRTCAGVLRERAGSRAPPTRPPQHAAHQLGDLYRVRAREAGPQLLPRRPSQNTN